MTDRQAFLFWTIATIAAAVIILAVFGLMP